VHSALRQLFFSGAGGLSSGFDGKSMSMRVQKCVDHRIERSSYMLRLALHLAAHHWPFSRYCMWALSGSSARALSGFWVWWEVVRLESSLCATYSSFIGKDSNPVHGQT